MTEFEIPMGNLRVRVEAESKEEAVEKVRSSQDPDRRMLITGDVREVDNEPVGMGSEAA